MNALCFLSLAAAASFLPLPGGEGGIGLDDLVYSPQLAKLLVPSGRTGRLNLVDPKTRAIDSIEGFSVAPASGQGHASGTTSADAARGFIFASGRLLIWHDELGR